MRWLKAFADYEIRFSTGAVLSFPVLGRPLSTLSFSMYFVPFSKLRQHGKLVPHEEARLANELVVIDNFDQLHSFLNASSTVFISHQWLDFGAPDPDNVHFDAICAALVQLCDDSGKNPDELHVWLDYSSIPQANRVLQKLSIDTLSVYASVCTFFVIVALHRVVELLVLVLVLILVLVLVLVP